MPPLPSLLLCMYLLQGNDYVCGLCSSVVITLARCAKCEQDKLLPALGLLVSCMYTVMYSGMCSNMLNVRCVCNVMCHVHVCTLNYNTNVDMYVVCDSR